MKRPPLCITTQPNDLRDGLFGNVFYHVFQILPYLYEQKLFPAWQIRTSEYGTAPDFTTIPGALDLAYEPSKGPYREVTLSDFRRQHGKVLGNDWVTLSQVWSTFFSVPPRVLERAEGALPSGRGLGIHYRGNDKLTTLDDSNPFTQQDYLTLIMDFISQRTDFDYVFAATDEFSFVDRLRSIITIPVINLGEVGFHKAAHQATPKDEKTDRALLDCILLSRCKCLLETSSALPSFAKVFNPSLEIYRCAASKLFQAEPYFPVAFIPMLTPQSPTSASILEASMQGDWTQQGRMDRYKKTFAALPRKPFRQFFLRMGYNLGADNLIRAIVQMRNRQIRKKLAKKLNAGS